MEQQQTQQSKQARSTSFEEHHAQTNDPASEIQSPQQGPTSRPVQRCVNCDIEFFWPPTHVQDKIYCCTGCAAGGPCNCDYSLYRSVTIMGVIYYEQQ